MARKPIKRGDDITSRVDEDKLLEMFEGVEKGFEAQRDRTDEILDNWDMYNGQLNDKQFYNGTSQLALPFVHDAVEARVTRFTNQIFPQSGRYVEVTTGETDPPQATQALLESYVRRTRLRTRIVPALLRNGDIEGSYNLYVSWLERTRHAQFKVKKQPTTDGEPNPAAEEVDDIEEEEVVDAFPDVEVISDPDILILPATADSIERAIDDNGSVTILRRWSKGKIRRMINEDEIDEEEGEFLIEEMTSQKASQDKDVAKDQLTAAGIKERGKIALIYETWTKLKVNKERRLCRIFFGGEKKILGVKLNPFWNDRVPIISAPVDKLAGAFKSRAPVCAVSDLQILANDTINEGADTAHFAAMPIVMTDPLKNPRVDTMVLGLGAVWDTNPNDTEIVTFPDLWKSALDRASAIRDQIFQTLSVSPAMIPQQTGSRAGKRNQAEMAIEQQVDLLTTADAVTNLEESVLTPLVQLFAEYDHQFRDKELTVRTYGPMGENANMEEVEPLQLNKRFEFRWFGVESARIASQMQSQISTLNVVKSLGPQSYPDYDLDLAPAVVQLIENTFGPRVGPLIFKKKTMVTVDPIVENHMLMDGFLVPVHQADDDVVHMAAHSAVLQDPDPQVVAATKDHMVKHQVQMQAKAQGQQAPQQGGGGGAPGGPKPGAQVAPPRQGKGPPGQPHPDKHAGAGIVNMPRRTG